MVFVMNYGVPDDMFVGDFDDLEFHYTWFKSMDDALQHAHAQNPHCDWDCVDNMVVMNIPH